MHVSDYQAAIFDAHLLFLQDPTVLDAVHQRIWIHQLNAEAAWKAVVDEIIAKCHTLEDSYQRARAADVADIRDRVLHLLTGSALSSFILSTPSILVAPDLSPSDVMQLDPHQVVGICTARGGVTAHSAILARALGIPAVVGVGPALLRVAAGTLLALDGQSGKVWIKPDHVAVLQQQRAAWLISQQKTRANRQQPAITRDGHRIAVVANIRGIHDVPIAVECGAEGVGLLRTEFLYLHRVTAPAEEEQLAAYHSIATALGTRPLIIRTLDVGGDKRLSYLNLPVEANPFLGWRGIRLCLDYPALLKTQLRAILRASPTHQMKILFPMISSVAEVRRAKEILHAVQIELRHAEIPFDESMEVGIMVEVPSAVMVADQLAAEVDFFSIGTNDLSQYAMAADRTNTQVASLADALHPAVLRLIHHTVQAAHAAGIWVGVCGELTGDPLATPILLGMGVDELSINPSAIPSIKQQVRQLTMTEATALAQTVVNLHAAEAVRQYVTNWLSRHNQERIDPS
jgi:phosphocarrier protein FPr